MGGSAADTPATPEYLRASDAERDRAISALRQEFVEGRLLHETFMFRMHSALGARQRNQLTGLFTDLPPRPARLSTVAGRTGVPAPEASRAASSISRYRLVGARGAKPSITAHTVSTIRRPATSRRCARWSANWSGRAT